MRQEAGFRVVGRHLVDQAGNRVILYGVNKMNIWTDMDGVPSFSEIAKTGANVVRIVWNGTGTAEELDTVIRNCWRESMIPMVENHDATGDLSKLSECVDYWVRPDVRSVLIKHASYLILNIANESGDIQVGDDQFRSAYQEAIGRLRGAGLRVPLVIDAPNWGRNMDVLLSVGKDLVETDPEHNLMLSIHTYWAAREGYDDAYVAEKLERAVELDLPLIVGEFADRWDLEEGGEMPFRKIMERCAALEIGYIAWSWGPGNQPQHWLDMTKDGTFETLHGWGVEVALSSPYSIRSLARRPWQKNR